VATTVALEVTLVGEVDPDRQVVAPPDVAGAVAASGPPTGHGLSRRGDGPWRLHYQLTGPDRLAVGQALERELRRLGHEADLRVS
jgi:hypothetical protein